MTDIKKVQYDFLQDAEDDIEITNIDYDGLISLEKKDFSRGNTPNQENDLNEEEKKEQENYSENSDEIIFYCRDCKAIVEVTRLPATRKQKVKFKCSQCNGKKVFYGTKRGVEGYFHLTKK